MGLAPPHQGLERLARGPRTARAAAAPRRRPAARAPGPAPASAAARSPASSPPPPSPTDRDATTPARTKDVLPAPESPITARSRRARMRCQSASTSPSRPKKRSASASVNEPRPGYGLVVPPSSPTSADRRGPVQDRLERKGQVVRRVEALLRLLRQAATHDPLHRARQRPRGRPHRRRVLVQDRRDRLRRRRPREGPPARQRLVENRPQREEVRPRVRLPSPRLLRREVRRGPHHDTRHRLRPPGPRLRPVPPRELRQAEVQDLHEAVRRQEQVLRLEVPVQDPPRVRRLQPTARLDRRFHRGAQRQRPHPQPLPQRLSFEQLEDDVGPPVASPHVEHRRARSGGSAAPPPAPRPRTASGAPRSARPPSGSPSARRHAPAAGRAPGTPPPCPRPPGGREPRTARAAYRQSAAWQGSAEDWPNHAPAPEDFNEPFGSAIPGPVSLCQRSVRGSRAGHPKPASACPPRERACR